MLQTNININSQDIANWALLSNDHNPIHFDLDAAKRVNLDTIVAHGKLALLPLKASVTRNLSPESGHWHQFKATFRTPVKSDCNVSVIVEQLKQRTRFKLSEADSGNCCIKGGVAISDIPELGQALISGTINPQQIKDKRQMFSLMFPEYEADWIVLESLLFSILVEKHLHQLLAAYSSFKSIDLKPGAQSKSSDNFVMQTNQETFFSASLAGHHQCDNQWPREQLQYQVGNLVTFKSANKDVCSLDIALLCDGQPLMLTRYGLILI